MKIFITGATGFLGRNLIHRLLAENHKLTALLLPDESVPNSFDEIKIVRGNITISNSLKGLLVDQDVVIHLASAVGDGQSMKNCLNIKNPTNIFFCHTKYSFSQIIHI